MTELIILLSIDVIFAITLVILFARIAKKVDTKIKELSSKESVFKISKKDYVWEFIIVFVFGLVPIFNIIACLYLWLADSKTIESLAYRTATEYIEEEQQRLRELQELVRKIEREVNERKNKE